MVHPAKARSVPRSSRAARSSSLFKRVDVRRAIRSAREEGLLIDRVEIDKSGTIIVHAVQREQQ